MYVSGDPSAGIPDVSISFNLGLIPDNEADREEVRRILTEAFSDIYDGLAVVTVEDVTVESDYNEGRGR